MCNVSDGLELMHITRNISGESDCTSCKKMVPQDILARYITWAQDSMYSQASAPDGGKSYVHT